MSLFSKTCAMHVTIVTRSLEKTVRGVCLRRGAQSKLTSVDHPITDIPAAFSKLFPATYQSVVYECIGQETALGISYNCYSVGQDLQSKKIVYIASLRTDKIL